MKKFTTAAIILILVLVTILSSCTNSEGDTTSTNVATSNDEWILIDSNVLKGPNNFKCQLEETEKYQIISFNQTRCLLLNETNDVLWVIDSTEQQMHPISSNQRVTKYFLDSNIIYWLNNDKEIWMSDWTSQNNQSERYSKDPNSFPFNN